MIMTSIEYEWLSGLALCAARPNNLPGMSKLRQRNPSTGQPNLPRTAEQAPPSLAPAAAGMGPQGPATAARPREIGGREGPEPTRYGDWEKNGRCIDF
jgi:hypothetical protein